MNLEDFDEEDVRNAINDYLDGRHAFGPSGDCYSSRYRTIILLIQAGF